MGAPIIIVLGGEPRGKGRPRFVKATGRAFTPAATRSYEAALRYAAQEAMAGRLPLAGALNVVIEARMPVPRSWSKKKIAAALAGDIRPTTKPDIDNLQKCMDALNEVAFVDDKQIVEAITIKRYCDKPALVIHITELDGVA